MSVSEPEMLGKAYEEAFNSGDIERILELYDNKDAVLALQLGHRAVGRAAIRESQASVLGPKSTIHMTLLYCIRSGDIALLQHDWYAVLDGKPMRGRTAEVARRQPDGSWLYIIDYVGPEDNP